MPDFNHNEEWDLKTLIGNYNKGLQAAINDHSHRDQFLSSIPSPLFTDAGKALAGSGKGKLSLPFKSVLFFDKDSFSERQQTGDCVSFGTRNAVDVSRAVQIHIGHSAEGWIVRGATEAIYGSRGHGGQGMSGSTAAQFVHSKGGILLRQKYPSADLTKYTVNYGIKWGTAGIPSDIIQAGREHQVTTLALIRTLDEARDALANGYGLACCSNQGFSSVRDNKGFARPQGSWSHCFPGNTWISGKKTRPIKDIELNDLVLGHDGKYHKVTHKFDRNYNGKVVIFRANGLQPITCTDEHPILIARKTIYSQKLPSIRDEYGNIAVLHRTIRWTNINYYWVDAKDLQIGDYLVTPALNHNINEEIKLPEWKYWSKRCKNQPSQILKPDDDLAWLFGLYISDGYATRGHRVVITLGSQETETINRAVKAFAKLNLKAYVKNFGKFVRITAYSSILANNFYDWFNYSAEIKRIPEFLFYGWNTRELINGMICGDGTDIHNSNRDGLKIYSTSKELIYQTYHFLISLGEHPRIYYIKPEGKYDNAKDSWSIEWFPTTYKPFSLYDREYYLTPIKQIETADYNDKVYNLEVEDVNTYIAEGVSVHNCMAWTACDDTGSEPAFMIQNSWANFQTGGNPDWGPMPISAFMAHADVCERMVRAGGTYAFSAINGFPPTKLPDYGTSSYL